MSEPDPRLAVKDWSGMPVLQPAEGAVFGDLSDLLDAIASHWEQFDEKPEADDA